MRQMLLALPIAALSLIASPTPDATAQDTKIAKGTVTEIGGTSLSVKVRDQEMKFVVDNKTTVDAPGGGTKTKQANAAGKPGPHLADVVKVGQAVAVTYQDAAGDLRASRIQAIASAGAAGGSVSAVSSALISNGTVQSMTADSITISGSSGGGASFTQTFSIDAKTWVVGKGASTKVAAKGGKAPFADLVANGDRVSVSYHKTGSTLTASDVRVTAKTVK